MDFNLLVSALLVAVPATIAALASLTAARRTKTSNGKTLGQQVEINGEMLDELDALLAEHIEQDQDNFQRLFDRGTERT